jgi:hypothetical protein
VEYDPDIQHLPAFAVTSKQFKGILSTYHEFTFKFGWFEKLCVSYQHYLYYPILLVLARTNLTIQSFLLVYHHIMSLPLHCHCQCHVISCHVLLCTRVIVFGYAS